MKSRKRLLVILSIILGLLVFLGINNAFSWVLPTTSSSDITSLKNLQAAASDDGWHPFDWNSWISVHRYDPDFVEQYEWLKRQYPPGTMIRDNPDGTQTIRCGQRITNSGGVVTIEGGWNQGTYYPVKAPDGSILLTRNPEALRTFFKSKRANTPRWFSVKITVNGKTTWHSVYTTEVRNFLGLPPLKGNIPPENLAGNPRNSPGVNPGANSTAEVRKSDTLETNSWYYERPTSPHRPGYDITNSTISHTIRY